MAFQEITLEDYRNLHRKYNLLKKKYEERKKSEEEYKEELGEDYYKKSEHEELEIQRVLKDLIFPKCIFVSGPIHLRKVMKKISNKMDIEKEMRDKFIKAYGVYVLKCFGHYRNNTTQRIKSKLSGKYLTCFLYFQLRN